MDHAPEGRITFGDQTVQPGSRNTVPERVTLSVDMRHPDQSTLDAMHALLLEIVSAAAASTATESEVIDQWNSPAVVFDQHCVDAVRQACQTLGYAHMDIVSGAGHDSVYVSRVARTGMVFVPCENGLSHNEAENAAPEDLTAGCNVLLHAMLALDRR
jgi:N-carbamoyl-L-amino-acid hydrolase